MKRPLVKVTQKHFDEGVRHTSSHCMIKEAIVDAIPGVQKVSVDIQTIRWTPPSGLRHIALTPRICQEALVAYDQGYPFEPFEFTLRTSQTVDNRKTPEQVAKIRVARQSKRARLSATSSGEVPIKIGGREPPKAIHQRRAYGLRALKL